MTNQKGKPLSGIITARNCPACGHHEIGFVSDDGIFHPLRAGSRILVMEGFDTGRMPNQTNDAAGISETMESPKDDLKGRYWVPEPLKGDPGMRMKYGVVLGEETGKNSLNRQIYESAFLQKLHYLLEKETVTPVAVLLDRFFAAPHLASGETKDIAINMWEELDEIRNPVERISKWLKNPDGKSLALLVEPKAMENLENDPVSDASALAELRALDLEDFLALL